MFRGRGINNRPAANAFVKGDPSVGTKVSLEEQVELPTPEADDAKNPAAARRRGRGDKGFSLIEIMAGMAIIAILAMAVLPQFSKYFERAAIQNLSGEISNAALLVESDHSLTGATKYKLADVQRSVAETTVGDETKLEADVINDSLGFTITGTNDAVKNYTLVYLGADTGITGADGDEEKSGLKVTKKK